MNARNLRVPRIIVALAPGLYFLALILFSGSMFEPYAEQALLPGPIPKTNNPQPKTKSQKPETFTHRWLGGGTVDRHWAWTHHLNGRHSVNHNAQNFLKPEDLKENPEWFPLIQGKRVPLSGGKGPNPNYAHPGFAEHVAGLAQAHFEANPDSNSFSLSVTDSLKFDESELTQAIVEPLTYFRGRPDYSDLVFLFANRVADQLFGKNTTENCKLKTENSTPRWLTSYAYYWAENVPSWVETQVNDAENNDSSAVRGPAPSEGQKTKDKRQRTTHTRIHPRVIPFLTSDRAQWWDPAYRENDQDLIRRWSQAGPAFIGGRDYYMGEGYFIPRVYPRLAAESIQFLARHNARAFYAEGRPIWGFDAPVYWLAAQMLYDPEQDPEALLDAFFTQMYGPAAASMRRFFERCEEIWMTQPGTARWIKSWRHPSQAELYPPDVCAELMDILLEAYEKVGGEKNLDSGFHVSAKPSYDGNLKGEDGWDLASKRSAFHWTKNGLYLDRIELTLAAFAFTQTASAYYHAWKACATNPLATREDIERFQKDLANFKLQTANLKLLPDIAGENPRWSAKDRLLLLNPEDRLFTTEFTEDTEGNAGNFALTQNSESEGKIPKAPTSGTDQLQENEEQKTKNQATRSWEYAFNHQLYPNDLKGLDAWTLRDAKLRNHLGIQATPTEHYEFRRLPHEGHRTPGAIQVKGSDFMQLYAWAQVEPGQDVRASVIFRGHLSGGARATLMVSFRREDGSEIVETTELDESPPGTFNKWIPLGIEAQAPKEAVWALILLRVLQQQPGDFVLLDDLEIQVLTTRRRL